MRDNQVARIGKFDGDLSFSVDRYDDTDSRLEATIARAGNLLVARAAFDEAVRLYPKANLFHRHGCRVIAENRKR